MRVFSRPWFLALALVAILSLAAVACEDKDKDKTPTDGGTPSGDVTPGPGVSDTEIKLGTTNDLAGTGGTPYGVITTALQAYLAKVNEEDGGVCDRDLTLIAEDDQYAAAQALEKSKKLVEEDQVLGIVSALGTGAHLGAVDYLNDPNGDGDTADGIPDLFVSTGFSGWGDYETWPWTTGYIPDYRSDGKILAQYINDNHAGENVGILFQNDPFGRDYLTSIKENLADASLLVSEQSYEPGAPDVSGQILSIEDAGAEVVVLASVPNQTANAIVSANTQAFAPQWVQSYVNAPTSVAALIGGGTDPAQMADGFALLEGVVGTNYLLDAIGDADAEPMVEHARIMGEFGGPGVSTLSVYGQSLAELLVSVVGRACDNLTREGLQAAVESTQGFGSSLMIPGIEVNLSPTDHYAIQALQPVQIEADGTLTDIGDVISVE
jgi:branched-chain amino acid transport system substrate-binding protein